MTLDDLEGHLIYTEPYYNMILLYKNTILIKLKNT